MDVLIKNNINVKFVTKFLMMEENWGAINLEDIKKQNKNSQVFSNKNIKDELETQVPTYLHNTTFQP